MTDLEKVIKGLECCKWSRQNVKPEKNKCDECPYKDQSIMNAFSVWRSCTNVLAGDALALLKTQEPRVFNVGDFYGEEFGYLEYRPNIPGFSNFEPSPILISDIDEDNVTVIFRSASVLKLPLDKMNKNWRIWSDYPTHELLKAVKWDD